MRALWIAALAAGGVAVAATAIYFSEKAATTTGPSASLTLAPGANPTQTIGSGGTLAITLPGTNTGKQAAALQTTQPYSLAIATSGTTSSASFTVNGSAPTTGFTTGNNTLTINWVDVNGAYQTSTIPVTVTS